MSSRRPGELPRWLDLGVIPLANVLAALALSGLVIALIGEDPRAALQFLAVGAFGYGEAIGYTLYYTTNFIFTGLAVAIAFHAGLFNIGGEGQAYIGGLGVGLACLYLSWLPFPLLLLAAIAAGALFGAAWAAIPAWLQARRGSHIVITTIMFNFIAAALMTYLLVNWMLKPGAQVPESDDFPDSTWMPALHQLIDGLPSSPLNLSIVWALVCCVLFWIFVWHTRWGYELRVVGQNPEAAVYAGISPAWVIMLAMTLSGALAGFMALNELMGVQHRIIINFTAGYGFVGIAVALMGRNHPLGICLAALLFGALYQGGAELAFEMPNITRDLVVMVQGLVILFAGAMEHLFRAPVARWYRRRGQAVESAL